MTKNQSIPQENRTNGSKPAEPPKLSVLEEVGNAVTHGVGAIFAIVALVLMLLSSATVKQYVSAVMYFAGLFSLFLNSCLYHSFRWGSTVKRVFRRFDYIGIYLLIGATFAPILLCYVSGTFGLVFCIVQWVIIAIGITLIGVFGPTVFTRLHYVLYLILGWSALVFVPKMIINDLPFFFFILGGGITYTLGMIPFLKDNKGAHFVWHFFVLIGAVVQWVGIYIFIFRA